MNEYNPDKWVIIKINGAENLYKVAGFWSGGYLDGDSYRINSGIEKIKEIDDAYEFYGYSGSKYICKKGAYGTNVYGAYILSDPIDKGFISALSKCEAVEFIINHVDIE